MGREVNCECGWPSGRGRVKALLESRELILRGGLKRRIALAAITLIDVVGDELRIQTTEEPISLHLGAKEAMYWATKLRTPPPTLREKLGLAGNTKTLVLGTTSCEALQDACASAVATASEDATMTVAIVSDERQIAEALDVHGRLRAAFPIWIVHGKGKAAPVGEALVRNHMRSAGYRDNKVVAVSDVLTATRYSLARRR